LIVTILSLRGVVKREEIRDVNLLPGDHDFFDQTWGYGLAIGKGETIEIVASQLPKVLDLRAHVVPMEGLLLRV